jgi:predicted MFS family arabinose efflux permease
MPPQLRRARIAGCLLFLLFGAALGAWTARVPAVKHGLGLDDWRLGFALLGLAAGAIAGQQVAGRLVDRFGSGRVAAPTALAEGALLLPAAYAPSLALLTVALLVFGVNHGVLNVAMNANALAVQRVYGRPIISSFHAVYSIGGFAGAALGGLCAYAGWGVRGTFLLVCVITTALAAWALRWLAPDPPTPVPGGGDAPRGRLDGVLVLGALAFCALVGEGAAADWSAVYLRDSLGGSAGFAAAGYAAFAIAMTAGRLVGDRLTARFGPVRLVGAGGLLAAAGLGAALLAEHRYAGVAGFACLGAGLSCVAPQVFSAATARNPAQPARALAVAVSMGYAGFLAGPVLIGAATRAVPLPVALAIPAALALLVAASAPAVRVPAAGTPGARDGGPAAGDAHDPTAGGVTR